MRKEQPKETANPLEHILYISLPEGTERSVNGFLLDSSHRIPIEPPPGKSELELNDLSWEMIVSAMLKIFAYEPHHTDIHFYRDFINAVQPNIVAELTRTGIIKAEAKDFQLAEEIFLALNHLAPEEYTTYLNLAFLYEEQEELYRKTDNPLQETAAQQAFTIYKQGLEAHQDSPDMHLNAGYFFLKHQNLSQTREHFEMFLGLAPEDERSPEIHATIQKISQQDNDDRLFTEAFDLIKLGQEQEALEKIDRFLERNPAIWNAWFLRGWAQRRLGSFLEGRTSLETCLQYTEGNTDLFNEHAICCMESGDFISAHRSLREALKREPENTKIISNFGVLEMKRGNTEEALKFFHTVLELDPDDPVAPRYIQTLTGK